jgi:hypothetical protein
MRGRRGEEAVMQIEEAHELGQEEAIRKIDGFLDDMIRREPPGGVTVTDRRKRWDGNRMDFSFRAAKGPFGATISGSMTVTDDRVMVESQIPPIIKAVVGEDRIRSTISRHLRGLLSS